MRPGILLLLAALGTQLGQAAGVTCYDCHGPHTHYPDCLDSTVDCDSGEVCEIKLGGNHPELRCHSTEDCRAEAERAASECHHDPAGPDCKDVRCCTDSHCVTGAMTNISVVYQELPCPESCTSTTQGLQCTGSLHCSRDKFCQLSQDEHSGEITGKCEPTEDRFDHCQTEVSEHHCGRNHDCRIGCCQDEACINALVGVPTTTTMTTTTIAPTTITTGFLTCSDFSGLSCDVLLVLCPKIHQDCPHLCAPCEITTTTTIATPPPTPAAACVDTLQGLECSSVDNACELALIADYCRKHCGTCS